MQRPHARSDIFSFGAVLYEMVAGRKAFDGTSRAGVIAAVLNRDVPPLSTVVPSASPALERVIRKCLVKDPAGRGKAPAISRVSCGGSLSRIRNSLDGGRCLAERGC